MWTFNAWPSIRREWSGVHLHSNISRPLWIHSWYVTWQSQEAVWLAGLYICISGWYIWSYCICAIFGCQSSAHDSMLATSSSPLTALVNAPENTLEIILEEMLQIQHGQRLFWTFNSSVAIKWQSNIYMLKVCVLHFLLSIYVLLYSVHV